MPKIKLTKVNRALRSLFQLVNDPPPAPRLFRRVSKPAWLAVEEAACALHGQRHVGGSGKPDCVGRGFTTEVKHRKRPIGSTAVWKEYGRSLETGLRARIDSTSGFTAPARELARDLGVVLRDL